MEFQRIGSAKVGHWLIYVPRESALKSIATFVKPNALICVFVDPNQVLTAPTQLPTIDSVIESVIKSVIDSVTYSLFPLPPPTLLLFPFLHLSLYIYRGLRTTFQ